MLGGSKATRSASVVTGRIGGDCLPGLVIRPGAKCAEIVCWRCLACRVAVGAASGPVEDGSGRRVQPANEKPPKAAGSACWAPSLSMGSGFY